MLKHIVMWRFREGAEGKSRTEHALWMKEHLEALVGVVPEIRSLEAGVDFRHTDASYDAALTVVVDDEAALERYRVHPAHQAIVKYCAGVREHRVVVDYEI